MFHKKGIEIKRFSISTQHSKISNMLTGLNISHIDNDRNVISPLELDIYIPSHNLAIELNGVYWHSDKYVGKNYHYDKWKACNDKGIQLIQIWEDDFNLNEAKIIKFIKYKLGLISDSIYARKCEIIVVDNKSANQFHNNFHIQGNCPISFSYGLMYDNNLVAICSFKNRGNSKYELVRYSTSSRVVGGFTKLLKYFTNTNKFDILTTFADLCISNGNLYNISGFKVDKTIPPDYKYVINGIRKHKFGYRKKKFKNDPNLKYFTDLTEKELAKLNGLLRGI